jgi:LuxR family maltose regulon positive regulatory protein
VTRQVGGTMATTVGRLVLSADRGDPGLLDDKLEVPGLGPAVSRRPRVDQLMEQATGHRVTLVTGPAGAGKTVACACWAAARRTPVGWLTVDRADREPARFWRYAIVALARAGALGAGDAEQLAELAATDLAGLPSQVVARITAAHVQAALVIDDVHELAGSPVVAGLDELVHHAPAGLQLVLAGRHAPGLTLAKLRVSDQLGDIGPADLACTSQEADAYLDSAGVTPAQDLRTAIMGRSEGWMAGLRLLSMSLRPDPGGSGLGPAGDLPDAHELVVDYVSDEILASLDPVTRQFLLRTCLTEVVPPDLATALTGDPAAAARLEQLSREDALVQPVGPGYEDYRYHPMLRTVLETVLRREQPDELPALLRQIARWHAGRGEVMAAVRAAARAGDWDFGREVLAESSPIAPPDVDWAELEEVLADFPPNLRTGDTVIAAALAAARLWRGDPDGALPHLDCAESAVAVGASDAGAPVAGLAADRLWLTALQVMRVAATGADLTAQSELAGRAHQDSKSMPQHRAVGLLWLALGCARLRRLEIPEARSALQHAGSQLAAGGLTDLRERARSWEAVAHAWYGDLTAATRVAAEVAEGLSGRSADVAAILAVSQARAHVARDEPEAAAMLLDQADQAAAGAVQPAGEPVISVLTGLTRTRIAIDEGNTAGARGLVRLLAETSAGEPDAAEAIAVLDAEISLTAVEPERARAALAALPDSADQARPEAEICQARLLMADADDKGALKLLEPVMTGLAASVSSAPGSGRLPVTGPGSLPVNGNTGQAGPNGVPVASRLAALLTAVVAHRRLNQAAEAAERLEEALALAEPDDQSGAFIAGGTPIRSALTVLITPASRCAGFASRILDRFDGRLPHGTGQPSGPPLTESELAVLRFLPSHMTNQEIAESLFLSINTIKTHLSSVYRKLGVTSRRQAIAQGRRLDLL